MDSVRKNKLAIFLFIFPAAILFITVIIIPIFASVYYSFFDYGVAKKIFVGLGNYKELFTNTNLKFTKSVINALILAGLSVFIQLPISLYLALTLAKGIKGERFFLGVFFLPVLLSTVVVGQLWKKIYFPTYGILNVFLNSIGLENLTKNWLGDPKVVLISVFIPLLWQYVGYHMLLMYAGIKTIPTELREAAQIDGATERQVSWYVTIPMLKPIIRVSLIFAVTGSLKAFDLIYVLTGGGPLRASQVPATLMVEQAFSSYRFGFGSSIAVSIIFLCFFFALLIKAAIKTEEM